jgi:hypothetical protein
MASVVRTGLISLVTAALLFAVYLNLRDSEHARQIAELEAINADMAARLAAKEAMIHRLGRSRRLAHLHVTEQIRDDAGRVAQTTFNFIELDDGGSEIARQTFRVPGATIFVDTWTAKFDVEDVALGHPMRGASLVLLRRVYSDLIPPRDGFPIDTPGAIPPGYATTDAGEFERRIWRQFWDIAADPQLARDLGVRVAQGEVVYKPVQVGERYELTVDAIGGISLIPLDRGDEAVTRVHD